MMRQQACSSMEPTTKQTSDTFSQSLQDARSGTDDVTAGQMVNNFTFNCLSHVAFYLHFLLTRVPGCIGCVVDATTCDVWVSFGFVTFL